MKVCLIGASGHYKYALDAVKENDGLLLSGASPGSTGEDISQLVMHLSNMKIKCETYDDYISMFDKVKPDIAVINCYFGDHSRVVLEALKRHINVFVEKPIATSLEQLDMIKEAWVSSGVFLSSMLALRYEPHFFTAWKSVKRGEIGDVRLIHAQKSYKLGERSNFYKYRNTYGGTIPWVGSHAIDWLHWFSGERFVSVYAGHSSMYNQGNGELEATAACFFNMTNEVMGTVSIDYLRPQTALTHDDDRVRIVGSEGIVEVAGSNVYIINKKTNGVEQLSLESPGQIFNDFVSEIKGKGKCLVSAQDSFIATEACLKARLSADTKKVVFWNKI